MPDLTAGSHHDLSDALWFEVRVRGGIAELTRACGVWALLDMTPRQMSVVAEEQGLLVRAAFDGAAPAADLCLKRLGALVAVLSATAFRTSAATPSPTG